MEGYDAKFDPPLEKRLECPICLLAQREPMQTPCGHRFCSSCILRALRETGPRCPVDNTKVSNHQLFKDNFAKREVLSLNVRCSANDAGCKWHGELRDLEPHCRYCDLVMTECYNDCGHCCQRKDLSSHLASCPNKPDKCPHCSVYFTCNRIAEHEPHCSKMTVPDSIMSNIYKASEVLKWCGQLKLKLTGHSQPTQYIQVSGYLTAKSESDECYMFSGNWCSLVNMMPLNAVTAKIFWKMLQGPEVLPKYFTFGFFNNDSKSSMFSKMLKKKNSEQSAVVGLNLKAGPNRPDLTIIYLYWSEQKRKISACVAELKSHLVRQIQSRLQEHYQARRGRSSSHEGPSHSHSRPHPSHSHNNGVSSSQTTHHHVAMATEPRHHLTPPTQPHFHPHLHHHVHPAHPTAVALVTPQPPHPVQAPTVAAAGSEILPSLLSWQMSQSLNTYPWRMQTGGVPFFTFPSTPPSYIPANSYPYTFAPLPAPPFSISPIQPGAATATVAVPSYTGIAVPQVTAVEPIVTLNSGPALAAAAGVVHPAQAPTYPVAAAAIQSLNESGEPHIQNVALTSHANPGATAVAVGINGATVNVIQQPVIQPTQAHEAGGIMVPAVTAAPAAIHASAHDLAVIHTLGPTHQHFQTNSSLHAARPTIQHVAHAPTALIQTTLQASDEPGPRGHHHTPHVHFVRSSLANMASMASQTAAVAGPSSVSSQRRRNESSIFVNSHRSRSSAYVSLPSSSTSTPTHSPSSSSNSRFALTPRVARVPSPSSGDESDSSTTSSLGDNFSTMFYPVPSYSPLTSDSDGLESPDHLSESPNPFSGRESTDILSDGSNNMSEQSDSEGESSSDSALHTLANAAVILADAPTDEMETGSSQPGPSHSSNGEPLRLPVLINISGSDSELSRVDTPPSVIDLTTSPTTSTPTSLSDSPPSNGSGPTSNHVTRNLQSSLESAASTSHDGHHLSHHTITAPLLLPVIQHQATNVIAANLAVTAQRTNAASFSAPTNPPQVQLTDHAHRIQDQGHPAANVPHANVHILGWPQPAQILNNEQLSVRNGAPNADITHVAVPSGPAVIAQQAPSTQFHAVNVVHSRANHSMLQRAAVSSAQPQGGFWDTVMPSLDMSLQGGNDASASRL